MLSFTNIILLRYFRLTAVLLVTATGCSSDKDSVGAGLADKPVVRQTTQQQNPPLASPTSQGSSPLPKPDFFQNALDTAESAATISQSAESKDDWGLVASKWQEAINLMKSVPQSSKNYLAANKKFTEYQRNLTYAQQRLARTPAAQAGTPPLRWVVVQCGKQQIVFDDTKEIPNINGPIVDLARHYYAMAIPFPVLYYAVGYGCKEYVDFLIAKGADVNNASFFGLTPLHIAWKKDMAAILLAKGASVNAKAERGITPLHFLAGTSKYSLKNIPEGGARELVATADFLIAKGAQVNARDDDGNTPLYHARQNNFQEMVELLKSKGGIE